jgi:lipoyl(octanoyl) transferase
MERQIIFRDMGIVEYAQAWDYQEKLFREIIDAKLNNTNALNYLLFCEHPHVYTLGKSGSDTNLLLNKQALEKKGATFFRTNRGGDITYHGPGQIVGYPILDLEAFNLGIRTYIEMLEESVISLLKTYDINAGRLDGASGVWLDVGTTSARKICAIGVRSSRFVTMHGFAFNVNTNLDYFSYINPCGFVDKGVTSMQKELGKELHIETVKDKLKNIILEMLRA